jgi:peptide/nickel transport system ATP-binding protein
MIEVRNLKKHYVSGILRKHITKALDGVDLFVPRGKVFGVTGESGCGKTTLALCLLRLVEPTSGCIRINGDDLTKMSSSALRPLRPKYQMIWQNPETSLNPRMRLRDAILEPVRYFKRCTKDQEKEILERYCRMVELPLDLLSRYPHEVSGGENQRAVIARILTMEPEVLVADEATSSLDILVQSQILNVLQKVQQELGITMVFISHDLQVIRFMCHRVAVMLNGRVIEEGTCEKILSSPTEKYSKLLMENSFGKWEM